MSTSRFGLGFENGSRKTPTGHILHSSEDRRRNAVRNSLQRAETVTSPVDWRTERDLITSRILWLDGLDEENAQTKERYIYIHGTNEEQSIGQAASSGCIRMRNATSSGCLITLRWAPWSRLLDKN